MNPSFAVARVRRMNPADLDRVIEIAESLKEAPHWPRTAYLAALQPNAAPPRIALVAEALGTGTGAPGDRSSSLGWGAGAPVAGFAVASLLPPQAELETIAVGAQLQRQGLARQLFSALAAELRTAQVTEVILEVRASNQPALGFYRRLGFVETGRRTRYYQSPVEDAILMRLGLEGSAPPSRSLESAGIP